VSVCYDDSKTRRAVDRCHPQTRKRKVNKGFLVLHIFEGRLRPAGVSGLSRWGWWSAKPRPKRQDLLAGRSADHDTPERCHG
jgi:hypothetical protein